MVPPELPDFSDFDLNHNKIDDVLDADVARMTAAIASAADGGAEEQLRADFDAPIPVEAIFYRPITQADIDTFVAEGGTVRHVYLS